MQMVLPYVSMRVKQGNLFPGVGIFDYKAIRLVTVASWTRKAEVFEPCFSSSRARHDMLDFKDRNGQSLRRTATGAAIDKMLGHSAPQVGGDVGAHRPVAPAC